jgi:DNA-directed RNA polymerase subunit alpha
MLWKDFQRPKRVEIDADSLTPTYGRFTAQPFERGFATTVGNAMRRCLLSSIEGAAITSVQIEGVSHEFSSIPGVVEDVTDIILNLKQIPIRLHGDEHRILSLDVAGPAVARGKDLLGDAQIEICEPELPIATLSEEGRLKIQAKVQLGRGYVAAEKNQDDSMGIGWVPVDSAHSPVRRVNYRVEAARVGRMTDYEKLIIEVWTNGTVSPERAVSLASMLFAEHLDIFRAAEEGEAAPGGGGDQEALGALFERSIDDFDLSVRSTNCLKNANIHTLRDLVSRSEKEMLETKGLGAKSLEELQALLERFGLSFGMQQPAG